MAAGAPEGSTALVSRRVGEVLSGVGESWTRRMFELGRKLRAESDAPVYDLSLGNPSLEPPPAFARALRRLAADDTPGVHRYMTNAGFAEVRAFVAGREARRWGLAIDAEDVVMTVGAAGALAIVLRALADEGDEVLVPSPCFSEYEHYARHAKVVLRRVPCGPDFQIDPGAVEAAISSRTRLLLLNSPNNPTGAVYGAAELDAVAAILAAKSPRHRPIVAVEDAPYRDLMYDGSVPPGLMGRYAHTVHVTSHSKDLGLAGERIGYAVLSPALAGRREVARALAYCNRTLGFVNAPALMQRVLPLVLGEPDGRVDVAVYARRARRLHAGLARLGFTAPEPRAGFFVFARLPEGFLDAWRPKDEPADVGFAERLVAHRCIAVPGTAFGARDHLRFSVAADDEAVEGALAAVAAALRE